MADEESPVKLPEDSEQQETPEIPTEEENVPKAAEDRQSQGVRKESRPQVAIIEPTDKKKKKKKDTEDGEEKDSSDKGENKKKSKKGKKTDEAKQKKSKKKGEYSTEAATKEAVPEQDLSGLKMEDQLDEEEPDNTKSAIEIDESRSSKRLKRSSRSSRSESRSSRSEPTEEFDASKSTAELDESRSSKRLSRASRTSRASYKSEEVTTDEEQTKKQKEEAASESNLEPKSEKKKKGKKESGTSEVSFEPKSEKKKKGKKKSATSEDSLEPKSEKKKKGKKKSATSEVSLEPKSEKKKKDKKESTTSEVSLEPGSKKKKKGKKSVSSTEVDQVEVEAQKKKKGKGKKSKGQKSDDNLKRKVTIDEPSSRIQLKESKSKSQTILKGKKRSQPSFDQLMRRLSLHQVEMDTIKSKSSISFGDFDVYSDSGSGSSEDEYEEEEIKRVSLLPLKKKKAKKEKGKKGKATKGETETEEEPAPKKKKKDKKGKKTKEKEVTEEETPVQPQDDVLAEITRMKYLAALQASGEDITETETEVTGPPKKKKGPKKKLSRKEKLRLAAEQAEKARLTAEEDAAKLAELERIRLEEEKRAAIQKEKKETLEQNLRMEQLEVAVEHIKQLMFHNDKIAAEEIAQLQWDYYVNCRRLPDPSKCNNMNTFLHLWENEVQDTSMEEASRRTKDVLELLDELDDLIDTANVKNKGMVEKWKWVRLLFRQQQAKSLDVATYRLLRNIEQNLHRIDIPTADYNYNDENIVLCLWLRVQLPTPLPNPRRPTKPRIELTFSKMNMEVLFPLTIDGDKIVIRALYVKYDHLSDFSESYEKPPVPEEYDIDLYDAMKMEWREKLIYKYHNRVRQVPDPSENPDDATPPEPEPEVFGLDEEIPKVPYRKLEPTSSEFVIAKEDEMYTNIRSSLYRTVPEDVINLRRYSIIGGVYSLQLIAQPPQPQDFVTLELNLTPLYLPKELELIDLYLDYNPPAPPIPGVRRQPEEIEEEMKRSEEELDKLILVTLTWPEHVIFLELPIVCFWDSNRNVWSKEEVHDLKHNEEKSQLTFRTRMGGTFALAVYRYANLPYQAWEMRPEADGTVTLQITAAILLVEFNVKESLVALSQLQNSPNNALQDIIGVYFPLPKLVRILQRSGVDVFPAFDAFCYVEGTCEKHWPMEKRLYFNMAQLSTCFNFAWSRWNLPAGRRSVVLQMREYNVEKTKQKNHSMLHVTPLYVLYVDCTEVSPTFNEEGIEGMKFYPDLYYLMRGTTSVAFRNKALKVSEKLIVAVYKLLEATRVVSFS